MIIIPLSQGKSAMIDDDDADMVSRFKWCIHKNKTCYTEYATASVPQSGKRNRKIYLHSLIMRFPKNRIDHRDGNGLDCRKHNLREATCSQNAMNQRFRKNNTTGFRGVVFIRDGRKKPYRVMIRVNRKHIFVGSCETAVEAAKAYNDASHKHHGEYGIRNLIPPD
jgi:hypothetical protein